MSNSDVDSITMIVARSGPVPHARRCASAPPLDRFGHFDQSRLIDTVTAAEAKTKLVPIRRRVAGGMKRQITVVDEGWWAPDPDLDEQSGATG